MLRLIVAVLPGWSIHLSGKAFENEGHWTCTLRQSSGRDNDAFVGIGRGRVALGALLAALLRTGAFRAGRT